MMWLASLGPIGLLVVFFRVLSIFFISVPLEMQMTEVFEEVVEEKEVEYYDTEITVDEPDKPAMMGARLEGETDNFDIVNTYDIDYFSRDVVGMVGVPIYVDNDLNKELDTETYLVFEYDESLLECTEEDLGILWLNEEAQWYETITDFELDKEANEVKVKVTELGTYILEDMKIWEAVWNGTYVQEIK